MNRFPLKKPLIYLITDGETDDENFSQKSVKTLRLIKTAIRARISFIQVREKNLSARNVLMLASAIAKLAQNSETKILVNDRADIALAANADGVHLTAQSISTETVRRAFPPKFIVGISAHTLKKAEEAKRQGADFATFSPIFASPNKGAPKGLNELRRVCEKLKPFPVIALGGIDEENYESVFEAGASGFAAIRFLNRVENLGKLEEFLTQRHKAAEKSKKIK
jgi:thiamine-phosphate pyrophosphorylase